VSAIPDISNNSGYDADEVGNPNRQQVMYNSSPVIVGGVCGEKNISFVGGFLLPR
jgi:hypothetical protein